MKDAPHWDWAIGTCTKHRGQSLPCPVCVAAGDYTEDDKPSFSDSLIEMDGDRVRVADPTSKSERSLRDGGSEIVEIKGHWKKTAGDPDASPKFSPDLFAVCSGRHWVPVEGFLTLAAIAEERGVALDFVTQQVIRTDVMNEFLRAQQQGHGYTMPDSPSVPEQAFMEAWYASQPRTDRKPEKRSFRVSVDATKALQDMDALRGHVAAVDEVDQGFNKARAAYLLNVEYTYDSRRFQDWCKLIRKLGVVRGSIRRSEVFVPSLERTMREGTWDSTFLSTLLTEIDEPNPPSGRAAELARGCELDQAKAAHLGHGTAPATLTSHDVEMLAIWTRRRTIVLGKLIADKIKAFGDLGTWTYQPVVPIQGRDGGTSYAPIQGSGSELGEIVEKELAKLPRRNPCAEIALSEPVMGVQFKSQETPLDEAKLAFMLGQSFAGSLCDSEMVEYETWVNAKQAEGYSFGYMDTTPDETRVALWAASTNVVQRAKAAYIRGTTHPKLTPEQARDVDFWIARRVRALCKPSFADKWGVGLEALADRVLTGPVSPEEAARAYKEFMDRWPRVRAAYYKLKGMFRKE